MIPGLRVAIDERAVVVAAERPLRVLSSAVLRGGLVEARGIVNLHVSRGHPCEAPEAIVAAFARVAEVPTPYVGLLTAARTERAARAEEAAWGFRVLVIATVGLSNRVSAGRAAAIRLPASTINTVVLVEGDPEPAALVNAAMTVTEVKALALMEAGVRDDDGHPATGTSTDAVVIAATGRAPRARFGGPASELGATVARAARRALVDGIRDWQERNG
jgi:iron complex transport system ATP-binding protein